MDATEAPVIPARTVRDFSHEEKGLYNVDKAAPGSQDAMHRHWGCSSLVFLGTASYEIVSIRQILLSRWRM